MNYLRRTRDRLTSVEIIALMASFFLMASCNSSNADSSENPSIGKKMTQIRDDSFWRDDSQLPVVLVDSEHSQLGGDANKTYEVQARKGFTIDYSKYTLPTQEQFVHEKRAIQVIPELGTVYCHPIVADRSKYSFCPKSGLHSGQSVIIAIGYEIDKKTKIEFWPVWVSTIAVK